MLWQPWQHYWDPASNVFWVISFTWTAGQSDLIIIINTPHLPSPHWWIFSHTDLTRILKYSLGHLVVHEITLPLSSSGKCLVVVDGGGILILHIMTLWYYDMFLWWDRAEGGDTYWPPSGDSGSVWCVITLEHSHISLRPSTHQVFSLSVPGILCQIFLSPNCLQMIICGPGINYQLLSRRCGGQPLNSQTSLVI